MKVTYSFEPTFLHLTFPKLQSLLTLKLDGKIDLPYASISKIVVQPPEAFNFFKGVRVGYRGLKDAAATYYHFDGSGPEFHLYSHPEKTVGFVLQTETETKSYDKVIVEIEGDPFEFANLVAATVQEKTGSQVIVVVANENEAPPEYEEKKAV
ncbi:hypothetical protein HK098_006313 [Nowakowskiella sp. JEL0407]|nr:hypothetical protein HK098_006313 [Nowakowskiella sp. JEL0407]